MEKRKYYICPGCMNRSMYKGKTKKGADFYKCNVCFITIFVGTEEGNRGVENLLKLSALIEKLGGVEKIDLNKIEKMYKLNFGV